MEQDGKLVSRNYNQNEEELMDLRRGPWTVDEDFTLINYVAHHGEGRWNSLARCAGLKRTGKSCRLRWLNYLRPDVRRGNITLEEQLLILELHSRWGNRWSKIAQHLPGRTDNEIKNYWRTRVQKHAKQLKCDVNSKQFKDTMRYLWMPRLVERIQAASASAPVGPTMTAPSSSSCTTNYQNGPNLQDMGSAQLVQLTRPTNMIINNNNSNNGGAHHYTPHNSSAAVSSDSFGTPASDLTDCYNNYPVNNNNNNNIIVQDNNNYYPASDRDELPSLTSLGGDYFNQGLDVMEQNGQWMDGGDVSDSLWNADDVWWLQQQFNGSIA